MNRFDTIKLKQMKRPKGRPKKAPTKTISFRVDGELVEWLRENRANIKKYHKKSLNKCVIEYLNELKIDIKNKEHGNKN